MVEVWVEKARQFTDKRLSPMAEQLDRENRFPIELLPELVELQIFGMHYPLEYNGSGLDSVTAYEVLREIARGSAGVALTLAVHWMACDALLKFGTESQKQKYLMPLLKGEKLAAFIISEYQAGSDASAITTIAHKSEAGWVVNGTKYFCTNGNIADLYFVAVKTDPEAGSKGISMMIFEKGAFGLQIGAQAEKMGCRSSVTTSLVFTNCVLAEENILGSVNNGFKVAMDGLVGGRLGMAVMGLGIAEAAFAQAIGYAKHRQAFGKPLSKLYAIQEKVADMVVKLHTLRLLIKDTALKRDSGADYAAESSITKLVAAETANQVCYQALQIYGGHGYMKLNQVERYARDARLMDIGVGSSEVLKMVLGMGSLR
jgi:alkylation response protein AidB-like acyl-CoA dehydrogenase